MSAKSMRVRKSGRRQQKNVIEKVQFPNSPSPGPSRTPTPPHEAAAEPEILENEESEASGSIEKSKNPTRVTKPRKSLALSPDQEDTMFEWLEENDLLWRKGHRHFKDAKRKRAIWERSLDVSTEHYQGWWRGMHTWYVKPHKAKSGQALKKPTDRETYVMQKCSFYEGELKHRSLTQMKPLPFNEDSNTSPVAGSEAGSFVVSEEGNMNDEDEELLDNLEKSAARAKSTISNKVGPRASKTRRQEMEEEDCLREITDCMKANTQLLYQLVGEKPG